MQQKANLGKAQGQASGGVPIRGGLQGIEFPAFRGFRCFAKMQNSSFHCMTLKEDLRRDDEGYAFLKKTRMIINPGEDAMHQM